jgi:sugar/nucleoside kinase (ribokinase family)
MIHSHLDTFDIIKRLSVYSRLMANISVVGHIAIDRVITLKEEQIQLGGPPTYVSVISSNLGRTVMAITKFGRDMPDRFLTQLGELGIDLKRNLAENHPTTRFILDYRQPDRSLSVESICEKIELEDLEHSSDCVLLTPIVGEIETDILMGLDPEILALDPQGLVRDIQRDGSVRYKEWFDEELLRRLDVYKSSDRELALVTGRDTVSGLRRLGRMGVDVAIATTGGSGSQIMAEEKLYQVPAYHVTNSLDTTGAGDVFIGAFFLEHVKGEDPLWCASVGSASASFVVETMGPEIKASQNQIYERAEHIFSGIKRL